MDVKRKTRKEMLNELNETVEFYTANPDKRGIVNSTGSCVYRHPKNKEKACAIGRKLTDAEIKTLRENQLMDNDLADIVGLFPKGTCAWAGFDIGFLAALQGFHDSTSHFDKDGKLTKEGKLYVAEVKEEIEIGEYDNNDIFL